MEKTKIETRSSIEGRKFSHVLIGLIIMQAVLLAIGTQVWGAQIVKKVNCDKGQTITHALQRSDSIPITIEVKGTCNENVEIVRDDVTLIGDPSDPSRVAVTAFDPDKSTIKIMGTRTVIDGLTVTGGFMGIGVFGDSTIQNCIVRNNGRNGIAFVMGSNGTVDNCTVQDNTRNGIAIEAAIAIVINSRISSNTGSGIAVSLGGSARIGITGRNEYAVNTISDNEVSGIFILQGGSAFIGGNSINGNAAFGVHVTWGSNACLVGNNTITGNFNSGVHAVSSAVKIGEPGFGLDETNVISQNGTGISGERGASLEIRGATIDRNSVDGVTLRNRSTATLSNDTINDNTGHGILLSLGGGLVLESPAVTVTRNAVGLQCNDNESSYTGNTGGIAGNTDGNGSGNCSGF